MFNDPNNLNEITIPNTLINLAINRLVQVFILAPSSKAEVRTTAGEITNNNAMLNIRPIANKIARIIMTHATIINAEPTKIMNPSLLKLLIDLSQFVSLLPVAT